jgi:hypothetical protein
MTEAHSPARAARRKPQPTGTRGAATVSPRGDTSHARRSASTTSANTDPPRERRRASESPAGGVARRPFGLARWIALGVLPTILSAAAIVGSTDSEAQSRRRRLTCPDRPPRNHTPCRVTDHPPVCGGGFDGGWHCQCLRLGRTGSRGSWRCVEIDDLGSLNRSPLRPPVAVLQTNRKGCRRMNSRENGPRSEQHGVRGATEPASTTGLRCKSGVRAGLNPDMKTEIGRVTLSSGSSAGSGG